MSQAPFERRDVRRMAAYLDGSVGKAYAFAHAVWVPDALETLRRLEQAVAARSSEAAFLCDHLREGARSVGAGDYVRAADGIEEALEIDRQAAAELVAACLRELDAVDAWLLRRINAKGRSVGQKN
jgi:hypothetical protein